MTRKYFSVLRIFLTSPCNTWWSFACRYRETNPLFTTWETSFLTDRSNDWLSIRAQPRLAQIGYPTFPEKWTMKVLFMQRGGADSRHYESPNAILQYITSYIGYCCWTSRVNDNLILANETKRCNEFVITFVLPFRHLGWHQIKLGHPIETVRGKGKILTPNTLNSPARKPPQTWTTKKLSDWRRAKPYSRRMDKG